MEGHDTSVAAVSTTATVVALTYFLKIFGLTLFIYLFIYSFIHLFSSVFDLTACQWIAVVQFLCCHIPVLNFRTASSVCSIAIFPITTSEQRRNGAKQKGSLPFLIHLPSSSSTCSYPTTTTPTLHYFIVYLYFHSATCLPVTITPMSLPVWLSLEAILVRLEFINTLLDCFRSIFSKWT